MLQTATLPEFKYGPLSEHPSEHGGWCPGSPVSSGNDVALPPAPSLTFPGTSRTPCSLPRGLRLLGGRGYLPSVTSEFLRWQAEGAGSVSTAGGQALTLPGKNLGALWVCARFPMDLHKQATMSLLLSPFCWWGNWGPGRWITSLLLVFCLNGG